LIVAGDAQSEIMRGPLEERYEVESAQNFDSAFGKLIDSDFDLVIVDLEDASSGVEFIKQVRTATQSHRTLMLVLVEWGTGGATLALAQSADAYEPKPLDVARVTASVERLLGGKIALATGTGLE